MYIKTCWFIALTWYSSQSLAVSSVASILLSQSRKFFSNSTSKSIARTAGFYWTGRLSAHFCLFHLSAWGLSTRRLSVSTKKALRNCRTEIHGNRSTLFKKEKAKITAKCANVHLGCQGRPLLLLLFHMCAVRMHLKDCQRPGCGK